MRHRIIPIVVALSIMIVSPALFASHPDQSTLVAGVKLAGDRLLSLQGTHLNGDTAVPLDMYDCAWEWDIDGSNTAYKNTQGPSAIGLLDVYEATNAQKYLAGAKCAGDKMVGRYDSNPGDRPYSDDVIFLVSLSDAMHSNYYAKKAKLYHARTRAAFPTGAALADHYIDPADGNRLSLSGWDLESQIEAALAVDQDGYAQAIALRLIQRRADWEHQLYPGACPADDCTIISQGILLRGLGDLDGKVIKSYRAEALANTLAAQLPDGSWQGDYQVTAYALIGLENSAQTAQVRHAIAGGTKFLLQNESLIGGWVIPSFFENGEVDGEVLSALAPLIHRHGFDADKGDDFKDGHGNGRCRTTPRRDSDGRR